MLLRGIVNLGDIFLDHMLNATKSQNHLISLWLFKVLKKVASAMSAVLGGKAQFAVLFLSLICQIRIIEKEIWKIFHPVLLWYLLTRDYYLLYQRLQWYKLHVCFKMKLSVKRNSQANRLSALFKGRKTSASGKHHTDDDGPGELCNRSKHNEHLKNEEQRHSSESNRSRQPEYLIVLHRILQEQTINTREVYSLAGYTITVEVLEDTEF